MFEILSDIDQQIFFQIHHYWKNDIFDVLLPFFRNKNTWIPLYIVMIIYFYKRKKEMFFKIVFLTVIYIIIGDFICAKILKDFFQRPRPCKIFVYNIFFHDFGLCKDSFGFPSCHVINHGMMSLVWYKYIDNKIVPYILFLWVLLIGYSQIYVGQHFAFDVVFGLIVVLLLYFILNFIFNKTNFIYNLVKIKTPK